MEKLFQERINSPLEYFQFETEFLANKTIPIRKFKSRRTDLSIYFAEIESQVINGYFCFGIDEPEAVGIEGLLMHLDSSGGLFPRPMRSEVLKPAWHFHGAENPLSDRDQSCYICSALGETTFNSTFSCSMLLLQNIKAVFAAHGLPTTPRCPAKLEEKDASGEGETADKVGDDGSGEDTTDIPGDLPTDVLTDASGDVLIDVTKETCTDDTNADSSDVTDDVSSDVLISSDNVPTDVAIDRQNEVSDASDESLTEEEMLQFFASQMNLDEEPVEPKILPDEIYCLSEAGEGAMAWEGNLHLMYPGLRSFWNRLLFSYPRAGFSRKSRECYRQFYRPDNLSVVVIGKLDDISEVLFSLVEFEEDYKVTHHDPPPFNRPWTTEIPKVIHTKESSTVVARFIPQNPNREPTATMCFGWRGCKSEDIETVMALKVLTAHLSVGPFWNQFVSSGLVHRISWCQLEYSDCCSLVTMHGISSEEICTKICADAEQIIADLIDESKELLNLEQLKEMVDRVGWHYVRELEAEPFLVIAASIFKGERYGLGEQEQVAKRLNPRETFTELVKKPLSYWRDTFRTYFAETGTFVTKVLPIKYEKQGKSESVKTSVQPEVGDAQPFTSSSRRASSRPRRGTSAVAEESNLAALKEKSDTIPKIDLEVEPEEAKEKENLQTALKEKIYPLGVHDEDCKNLAERLEGANKYLQKIINSTMKYFPIQSYKSDSTSQHEYFPVDKMPFYTCLEDVQTSFVYATMVFDTTHLDERMRKAIAPITAALGAALCPRPPGLDTDSEIKHPNEFNPPMNISDSQISLGLNGELMQSIFITVIVLPEKYDWVVGLFHHLLHEFEITQSFMKFVCTEAVKGLAANYRMQTVDVPNYDSFDAAEINLHSLVKMIYKPESNARLFVGRRRLDTMNEFLADLTNDPEGTVQLTIETWRKIVDSGKIVVQIGANTKELSANGVKDLTSPWNKYFGEIQKSLKFEDVKPKLEPELMLTPGCDGIAVTCVNPRPSCLTTAIPIDPNSIDFPKLCITAQLFSTAQKWIWTCLQQPDSPMAMIRMPCSYSNMMTLNLESLDLFGALDIMKKIVDEDWEWLESFLVATKLIVVNDPAAMDQGPQGTIVLALLAHLHGVSPTERRNLILESLKVTKDDIKYIIRNYLTKLFDPKQCWYSLMTDVTDQDSSIERLKGYGFNFQKANLYEVCKNL